MSTFVRNICRQAADRRTRTDCLLSIDRNRLDATVVHHARSNTTFLLTIDTVSMNWIVTYVLFLKPT